jgi:hypothetical protein
MKKIPLAVWIAGGLLLLVLTGLGSKKLPNLPEQNSQDEHQAETHDTEYVLESYKLKSETSGKLVPDFPDLPSYPNAKLIESKSYTEEEGLGFSAKYQINDSLSNIFNWYQEKLIQNGWEISYASQFSHEPNNFLLEVVKRGPEERDTIVLGINGLKSEDNATILLLTYHQGMGEYGPATNDE